ncbi:MAG: Lrp/AsnC family transcriptional regulator [Candidatus ainarchaeum sp.]|nr:Lrp/AsnC family transcriptional regulator [Candidatus ainarchaeum sp.]
MSKKSSLPENAGVPRNLELKYGEKTKLDDKDKQILTILAQNGRASTVEIAKEVGLSRDAVKYRIDKMLREEVIQGFVAVMNPPKMGLPFYSFVQISLLNLGPEREKKLIGYIKAAPYIVYSTKIIGRFDIYLEVFAKDPGHLDEIVRDIREKFSDIIKDIEVTLIIKEYKWTEFPGKFG